MFLRKTKAAEKAAYTGIIPNTPLRFAFFAAKQNPVFATCAILSVTLAQLCEVFLPFILKQIIDLSTTSGIQTTEHSDSIFIWVLAFPVVTFLMFGLWRSSGFFGMEWLTRMEAFAYKTLFNYLSQHSHTYFSNRFAGSVTNKLAHAAEGTFRLLDGTLWGHYGAVLGLIASGALIFMTSVHVGIVYVVLIMFLIPLNYFLAKYRQPHVVAYAKQKTALRGRAVDVITNAGAMRQFSKRAFELQNISKSVEIMRLADVKQWRLSEFILVINNVIIAVSMGIMLMLMYVLWKDGAVSIGDFVLVLTLVMSLQHSLTFIGNSINQFIRVYGEVEEGLDEILLSHEILDDKDAQTLVTHGGEIAWKDVTFEYGKNRVFDGFNLVIKPGERIGLVGPSGAGKTTFVSLLLRQHNIDSGEIFIDGQNIMQVTQDSLVA